MLTAPNFAHLASLSGPYGTYEHAEFDRARVGLGYCTDDVARVVVILQREKHLDAPLTKLLHSSLRFVRSAQCADGTFRNRRDQLGVFHGPSSNRDWWGRAMWSLGTSVARNDGSAPNAEVGFARGSRVRTPWPRAAAYAVLGASAVWSRHPGDANARHVFQYALETLDRPLLSASWRWPEAQLTYANALWPDALIAIGVALDVASLRQQGLEQLEWLVDHWTRDGHLSVSGHAGSREGDDEVGFDQQPIEVATLSEACCRAYAHTGDDRWRQAHALATGWFHGENDQGVVMYEPATGGGYDGLTRDGVNANRGAESTVSLLMTLQNARTMAAMA